MRVLAMALNAFKESVRDRILYLILVFAVLITGASVLLSSLSAGQEYKIVIDLGLASISVFGLLITIFVGTTMVHKEIDKRTIYILLSKPVRRYEVVLGKHIGLSLTLLVLTALMGAFFYAFIYWSLGVLPAIVLEALAFSFLELVLLVAVAILFSTFASPTMSAVYTFCIYIIGHFSGDLRQLGKLSKSQALENVTAFLYYVLPDLERFNVKNDVIYNQWVSPEQALWTVAYGLGYTALLLLLSALLFEWREF